MHIYWCLGYPTGSGCVTPPLIDFIAQEPAIVVIILVICLLLQMRLFFDDGMLAYAFIYFKVIGLAYIILVVVLLLISSLVHLFIEVVGSCVEFTVRES